MAKGRRARTLAEQIAELDDPKPRDFDPEEINDNASSDDDQSDGGSEDQFTGREHYVNVGKSKLRKRDIISLGPQYAGSKVSRKDVEDEDSDDPFSRGFDGESSDEESDEENEEGDSDEEVSPGTEDEEDENSAGEGSDQEDGEDEEEGSDEGDSEDDDGPKANDESYEIDRAKLRKMMKEESKTVAATISLAAKADAEKGRAVKAQRKTFDSILNARIRLQKALIASNTLAVPTDSNDESDADTAAVEAAFKSAETAALNLLNNVTRLRAALDSARTGTKRSAAVAFSSDTSSEQIWSVLQISESANKQYRNTILEKWSAKSRPTQVLAPSRRLNNTATQQTLTSVLQSQLSDSARLIAKTQMPRSCAPKQTAASPAIYDDADFYGVLLKELLEQRSADFSSSVTLPSFDGLSAQYRAAREAKTKKIVDTRASKGRKLRYVVHEKLQNYMAPEDRGHWGERQIDELFGSLLGRKLQLEEDDEADQDMENQEEAGLLMFRSS